LDGSGIISLVGLSCVILFLEIKQSTRLPKGRRCRQPRRDAAASERRCDRVLVLFYSCESGWEPSASEQPITGRQRPASSSPSRGYWIWPGHRYANEAGDSVRPKHTGNSGNARPSWPPGCYAYAAAATPVHPRLL
jgi:hypothetical protein